MTDSTGDVRAYGDVNDVRLKGPTGRHTHAVLRNQHEILFQRAILRASSSRLALLTDRCFLPD